MADSLALVWDLIARDNASGTFAKVGASAEGASGAVKGLMAGFTALAAGGAIAASIKSAADFQKQMLLIQTQSGDTTDNLGTMSKAILALAGPTAQAPEALATSLRHMTDVGLRGSQAIDAVKVAAEGAAVGHADLEATTNSLTSTIASNMVPATETYSQVMGKLNAIVGAGDMSMTNLNDALSNGLLPTMHLYGVSLTQVGAALATFGDVNLRGQVAATDLRMAVQSFFKLTMDGPAILAKYHLSQQQLIDDLHQGGLTQALTDLHDKLVAGGVATNQWGEIITQVFGKKAGVGLATLLDEFERYNTKLKQVSAGANDFGTAWDKTTKTASFRFGQLKDGVEALGVKMGTALLPPISAFAGWLANTGIPAVEKFGTAVGHAVSQFVNSSSFQSFVSAAKSVGSTLLEVGKDIEGVVVPAVMSVFKWFGSLPGPVQTVIEVFGALRIATAAGWLDGLASKIEAAIVALGRFGGGASTAINQVRTSFGIAKTATEDLLGSGGLGGSLVAKATANVAGLGNAMATVAKGGLGALAKAGGSVIDMLGGPLLVSITAVGSAVAASIAQVNDWGTALLNGGNAAFKASQQMDEQTRAVNANITQLHGWHDVVQRGIGLWNDGIAQFQGYANAADEAQQHAKALYDQMSLSQQVQQDITTDQNNLNLALDQYGKGSSEAKYQAWLLNLALGAQQTNQQELDIATRGTNGAMSAQLDLQRQLSQSGLSLDQAQLSASQSINSYKSALKDANLTEDARAQALDATSQAFFGVLDAAKAKADAETKGLPAAITTNQEIVRQRDALDAVVNKLGFVPPALQSMYDSLNGPTAKALQATQTAVDNSGTAMTTVTNQTIPGMNKALGDLATAAGSTFPQAVTGGFLPTVKGIDDHLNGPTNTAFQHTQGQLDTFMRTLLGFPNLVNGPFQSGGLQADGVLQNTGGNADTTAGKFVNLGKQIAGLPPVNITANTSQADQTIQSFLQRVQSQGFVGALWNLNPVGSGGNGGNPIGLPPIPHRAIGGAITGPGTGTSDSVLIAASNGEHMWTTAEVNAAGGHASVAAMRKAVLAAGRGFAAGGPILPRTLNFPVDAGQGLMSRIQQEANAALLAAIPQTVGGSLASVGAMALVQAMAAQRGWGTGAEWAALAAVVNRESGWNPNAANPTSSARGLFQMMTSIYGPLQPTVQGQANWGLNYIGARYGDPIRAWAHELNYGWYDNGGGLKPGWTMAYNGTGKTETIRTAEQESALGGDITVIAQFGEETIEARTVRVVRGVHAQAALAAAAGSSNAMR